MKNVSEKLIDIAENASDIHTGLTELIALQEEYIYRTFTWSDGSEVDGDYKVPVGTTWAELETILPELWRDRGFKVHTDGYMCCYLINYICVEGSPDDRILGTDTIKADTTYTPSWIYVEEGNT